MAGFEKGTKRQCQSCEVKFYDLNRDPIICPGCGETFVITTAVTPKVKEEKPAPVEEKSKVDILDPDPDVISLDEVEEEEIISEAIPDVDDVEVDVDDSVNADQQDTFLEEDDEDGAKIDLGISSDISEEQ